jgi:hypothetical protein
MAETIIQLRWERMEKMLFLATVAKNLQKVARKRQRPNVKKKRRN